ncbi:hypothetical protein CXF72_18215 [Psychromonas sp. MB-3u-54]|nr:hypothetical protein CXF72_18215 [Psychromonas sp. MB-3u-54]
MQYIGNETARRVRSAHRFSLLAVRGAHPTDNIIPIHPDGFVSVNFSFEASDHKRNNFGIS